MSLSPPVQFTLCFHGKWFDAFQCAGLHPKASIEIGIVMGKRAGNIHLCEDVARTHTEHSDLHQRALTDGVKEISPYGH